MRPGGALVIRTSPVFDGSLFFPAEDPAGCATSNGTRVELDPSAEIITEAEISDTLVIAEQTTKTHVGRILGKLDLRDRAQAVVLAYESGLVTPGS